MYCTECGEAEQEGNFCRKCGYKLRRGFGDSTSESSSKNVSGQNQVSNHTGNQPFVPTSSLNRKRIGFGEAIGSCLKKYAVFKGRATRGEYWYWQLLMLIVFVGSSLLASVTDSSAGGTFFSLLVLGAFLPSLSVLVRRLHDTGKSGWWVLISAIPIAGSIIVFIFTLQYSDELENQYGFPAHR